MSPDKPRKKARLRASTIILLIIFFVVLAFGLTVYSNPGLLDPLNEMIWGQRPIVEPAHDEIVHLTTPPTFSPTIDQAVRLRFFPTLSLEAPITEMGKANPFAAVSP